MKRIISVFLILCMVVSLITSMPLTASAWIDLYPDPPTSGTCGENLTWVLENGTLTISGTGPMNDWTIDLAVPWHKSKSKITNVVINYGATNIEWFSFANCNNLVSVIIPESIISIDNRVFENCTSLKTINIPSSVTVLGREGTSYIDIFENCSSLENINIHPDNENYCSIDGVLFSKDKKILWQYPDGKSGNYDIPSFVSTLGDYAFLNCNKIINISIPSSIENVGEGNFHYCSSLCNIFVSEGSADISSIDGVLFSKDKKTLLVYPSSRKAESYIIPDTVTTLEYGVFHNCANLKNVTIPDKIWEIPGSAFENCSNLNTVYILGTIGRVGYTAFENCYNLSDIYYAGSEEDWNNIKIGTDSNHGNWFIANKHFNYIPDNPNLPDDPVVPEPEYTFKYYSDKYFEDSSYTYNPSLATMSMYLAHSAFASSNKDRTQKSENVKALLKSCQFDMDTYETNDYLIGGFDNENAPTTDSIGVAGASKSLGDYTLIAIAVRGGGYGKEWSSNVTIGNEGQHQGFREAKENVLDFLNKYITNNNITGKIKVWITGFSRAAATSNLTAAALDDGTAKSVVTSLGETVSLSSNDVYAYCFETPAGGVASVDLKSAVYKNIFNIINPNDPVPKVAPAAMGFGRYGVDKILPTAENYSDYKTVRDKMVECFETYGKDYIIDDFQMKRLDIITAAGEKFNDIIKNNKDNTISQSMFLDDFITTLSNESIKTREKYVSKFQTGLRDLLSICNESGKKQDVFYETFTSKVKDCCEDLSFDDIVLIIGSDKKAKTTILTGILEDSLKEGLNEAEIPYESTNLTTAVTPLVDMLVDFTTSHPNLVCTLIFNPIFDAHDPELCLAWLLSMDKNYRDDAEVTFSNGYRVVRVNCPVDVTIKNSDGDIVAKIVDDVPQKYANSTIVAAVNDDGEKLIYLPSDSEYDVDITATDNGKMNYSINEYNPENGDISRIVNYYNVDIATGDVLLGNVPQYSVQDIESGVENGTNTLYTLSRDNGEEIAANVDLKGDLDANRFLINAISENEEKGIVTGSGEKYEGNFVQLEAIALEGYEFDGWYAQNVQVSQENPYRFCVTQDIELTAKFKEAETYPLEFECEDGGQIIVGNNGNYYEGKKIDIEAKADSGYSFAGWTTSNGGTFANANSSSTTFTMPANNTTITAKFTKKTSSPAGGGGGGVSTYTIKFETNGGSAIKTITVNKNAVATEPTAPTKDGFKFDGWYTDKELTTAYDFTAKVTKNFTLYAKWTKIEKEPEVDDTDKSMIFIDVKATDWFYANVQYVVENKLMNGVAEDTFAPNDTLTRAMLVTVLYRKEGEPATNRSIPFADVDMGAYYANAVSWAKQNGIVNGVTENKFAPDANITREQIAAIIFRYAQYKGMETVTSEENLHFADANEISEYAVSAMNWSVGTGLMKGKSTTTINPKENATRAEIAAILQRFIEFNN